MGEDKNYARRVENRSREGISGRMQSFYSPLQEHHSKKCAIFVQTK